jgi:Uma2 family endonuclease
MTIRTAEPRSKRWTREEFYRLAEEGYFRGQRVQLIEGEVIEMAPQGHAHAKVLMYLTAWAGKVFTPDYLIRIQMPLHVTSLSDPEPDVAIVAGPAANYTDHPGTAVLVVEVADSSIRLDRRKAKLYAAADVPDYWIVNLPEQRVEVYRSPDVQREEYEAATILNRGDQIAPLARPTATISVTDLLS